MVSNATQESVRSILRRCFPPENKLNILTFCTHERYEQNLCMTGHEFYSIKHGKTWNKDYGVVPKNYHEIVEVPTHINFDLILSHTSCERIAIAKELQSIYNIPIIRHTHVLPDIRFDIPNQVQSFNRIPVDHDSFISRYNMGAWGKHESANCTFVEHGIDTEFWDKGIEKDRDDVCLSVVNDWPNRDWCCGWNLWNEIVSGGDSKLPVRVLGDSPGFSKPAETTEALRDAYKSSSIFLNTSIHSPVPTVLMEAMACGCAIVSTNNCMIPEIITHGENGLLANSADELREHCLYLLHNPDEARKLGENAKATIQDTFSLKRFTNSWNELFTTVIQNYR